jgi:hypothetical protein
MQIIFMETTNKKIEKKRWWVHTLIFKFTGE